MNRNQFAPSGRWPGSYEERFWARVVKNDGECWLWTGAKHRRGYGWTWSRTLQRPDRAHRIAWEISHGPIPRGLSVLHRCDNPGCVRPDHLFLGTIADNVADMWAKGRGLRGERSNLARLTEDDVREIRALSNNGASRQDVANRFGISPSGVYVIARRKAWKHVV